MQDTTKIYVDIQSLLEMRQSSLIHLLGEEKAIELIHKEAYYLRDIDAFDVDMVKYNNLIAEKSAYALNKATVTYIVAVLSSRLAQSEKLNAFNDTGGQTELIVNTHPYAFEEKVMASFKSALFVKLGIPVIITLICRPVAEMTPSFIKHSGITQFYCYDSAKWLETHVAQIPGGALKDVRVFFPTLGRAKLTKEHIKSLQKTGFKDIFAYTEFLFSQHVKIQFLPVVFYSNLITATAVLETFNENVKNMKITDLQGEEDGNISDKG